jgi:hypothetical protein
MTWLSCQRVLRRIDIPSRSDAAALCAVEHTATLSLSEGFGLTHDVQSYPLVPDIFQVLAALTWWGINKMVWSTPYISC